jgi:hypothetical protein
VTGLLIIGALLSSTPRACVHGVGEARPRVTLAEQRLVKRVIEQVVSASGAHPDLGKLLTLVAERESSWQLGVVHRLPADLDGSRAAWRHTRALYEGNAWAADASRWQTYGLFGMNSSYFTVVWDRAADPRILCDAVVDVLVYRRALVRALRRLSAPVECDGEMVRVAPTWAALHGAVSGGRRCPTEQRDFYKRARRAKLDADRVVTLADLGHEPEAKSQDELVRTLWGRIETR